MSSKEIKGPFIDDTLIGNYVNSGIYYILEFVSSRKDTRRLNVDCIRDQHLYGSGGIILENKFSLHCQFGQNGHFNIHYHPPFTGDNKLRTHWHYASFPILNVTEVSHGYFLVALDGLFLLLVILSLYLDDLKDILFGFRETMDLYVHNAFIFIIVKGIHGCL